MAVTIDGTTGITTTTITATSGTVTTPATGDNDTSIASTAFVNAMSLGVGQTWTDVKTTPGRLLGTTYTNSTGKPIAVSFSITNASGGNAFITVSGVTVAVGTGTTTNNGTSAIVPNGATYVCNGTVAGSTLNAWAELR